MEIHMNSPAGDLKATMESSRRYVMQMLWVRSSLNTIEQILQSLQHDLPGITNAEVMPRVQEVGREIYNVRSAPWVENLKRQLKLLRNRINDLLERQRADEATVGYKVPYNAGIYSL